MTKSWGPIWRKQLPGERPREPPRRDTRALSPAGVFGGKAPPRLAAQKSWLHAPSAPMRRAPAYFFCNKGVKTRLAYAYAPCFGLELRALQGVKLQSGKLQRSSPREVRNFWFRAQRGAYFDSAYSAGFDSARNAEFDSAHSAARFWFRAPRGFWLRAHFDSARSAGLRPRAQRVLWFRAQRETLTPRLSPRATRRGFNSAHNAFFDFPRSAVVRFVFRAQLGLYLRSCSAG